MNGGVFPVSHSIMSGGAILALIMQGYALESSAVCRLLKQSLNDTYSLAAGQNQYIVRVYRAKRPAGEISYELELLVHLAAKGVPVAVPLPAKDGRLALPLVAAEGVRYLVIFTYVPGSRLTWTKHHQGYLAGRLLAAVHGASDDFASTHCRPCLDEAYLIDTPLAAVQPLLEDRRASWMYLEELAGRIRFRLRAAARAGLDWGVCHGDFGAKNMHITDDDKVSVIDFDFCGPGWRAYDFASVRRAAIEQGGSILWDSFLRGYTEIRTLAPIDIGAVTLFRGLRQLSMLGVFARNLDEWGISILTQERLERWIRLLSDWEAVYLKTAQE
jgi:Ser/Thr protein kinase RdoA (MazF antagonist)